MKTYLWSIISVAVVWKAKPCRLVRSNKFRSCLLPSAACSRIPSRQVFALLDPSKRPNWNKITSHKFWIINNIFKNLVYRRRRCLIWKISIFKYHVVLWEATLFVFTVEQHVFLQYSRLLECLILKWNVKLEVLFRSVGLNLYLKCRCSSVFVNVIEVLKRLHVFILKILIFKKSYGKICEFQWTVLSLTLEYWKNNSYNLRTLQSTVCCCCDMLYYRTIAGRTATWCPALRLTGTRPVTLDFSFHC